MNFVSSKFGTETTTEPLSESFHAVKDEETDPENIGLIEGTEYMLFTHSKTFVKT